MRSIADTAEVFVTLVQAQENHQVPAYNMHRTYTPPNQIFLPQEARIRNCDAITEALNFGT